MAKQDKKILSKEEQDYLIDLFKNQSPSNDDVNICKSGCKTRILLTKTLIKVRNKIDSWILKLEQKER